MAAAVVRQSLRPFPPSGYIANGPLRQHASSHKKCGHGECSHQWDALPHSDKKQWEMSAVNSRYLWGSEAGSDVAWVPPSQRPPLPQQVCPQAEDARILKQTHLHGNVGVITNVQPSTTDSSNFLVRVPYRSCSEISPPNQCPSPRLWNAPPKDRKVFEQSSEIFNTSRNLAPSTLSPREDLFDVSYGNFPYCDTGLDAHVRQKLTARGAEEPQPPATPSATHRATQSIKFEPPMRPGAAFRRRTEKNFSDLFDSELPLAAASQGRRQRSEIDLACGSMSFQDIRTEAARRNGDLRDANAPRRFPMRMRSAPELPDTDKVRGDADTVTDNTSKASAGGRRMARQASGRLGELRPAGGGGTSGGAAEYRQVEKDEERLDFAARDAADADGTIWKAMRKHNAAPLDIEEISSPLTRARRQTIAERQSQAFGEATKIDWNAVHSPRAHIPGMDTMRPPRQTRDAPWSPRSGARELLRGSASPRDGRYSPRAAITDEIIDSLPCKAASRGNYQRAMSSDPADLFGAQ